MPSPTLINGDVIVAGRLSPSALDVPPNSLNDSSWSTSPSNRLTANKIIQQFPRSHSQAAATDATTETRIIHVAKGAGTVAQCAAAVLVAPATGNKQITIDLQKSTGGAAFATMLNAPVTIAAAQAALTQYQATLAPTPTYAAGDILAVVITASGSTGTQAQGAIAEAVLQENPS